MCQTVAIRSNSLAVSPWLGLGHWPFRLLTCHGLGGEGQGFPVFHRAVLLGSSDNCIAQGPLPCHSIVLLYIASLLYAFLSVFICCPSPATHRRCEAGRIQPRNELPYVSSLHRPVLYCLYLTEDSVYLCFLRTYPLLGDYLYIVFPCSLY